MVQVGNLIKEKPIEIPYSSYPDNNNNNNNHDGIIFHHGNGQIAFNASTATTNNVDNNSHYSNIKKSFLWRYNMDLYILSRLVTKILTKLQDEQQNLVESNNNDNNNNKLYTSPDDFLFAMGVPGLVHNSFDSLLDKYMVKEAIQWWRRYLLSSQGSLRLEALSSMVLAICNQDISNVNALAGLIAFAVATDDTLYHIQGGNSQLISTAWNQAKEIRATKCPTTT